MSGEAFVRQYREGAIEDPYRLEVARVAMLLPLAESYGLRIVIAAMGEGALADTSGNGCGS